MTTYHLPKQKINYRQIYKKYHGPIPKDENGSSYDIHHVDGNRKNNDPSNLIAVSMKQHYDIHYKRGDWAACLRLASRMKLSQEEKSELARKSCLKRVKDGTNPFVGGKNPVHKRVADGIHHTIGTAHNYKMISEGKNAFVGGEVQRKRVENGTHHFLSGDIQRNYALKKIAEGTHPTKITWVCPHCNKHGMGKSNATRWHYDNCKSRQY